MTVFSKSNQQKLDTGSRHFLAGNLVEAERLYLKVLASEPANPLAHELLAKLYLSRGEMQKADKHFTRLLVFRPGHAECTWLRGFALFRLGDLSGARELILASLRKVPDNAEARRCLHSIYKSAGTSADLDAMVDNLEHLARLTNYDPALVLDEVEVLERHGEIDRAAECLRQAQQHNPRAVWRLRDAMLLSPIMDSVESIAEMRRRYEVSLDRMLEDGIVLDKKDPIPLMSFYLAFHGVNNRTIMQKMGRLFRSQEFLQWQSPNLKSGYSPSRKLKVGFCSTHFVTGHSIANSFWDLIQGLAKRETMEIVMFPVAENADAQSRILGDDNIKTIVLPRTDWEGARDRIAREELDVLVYTDIGMHSFVYLLAFLRLAPVQCVMLGHPDTTGIPTIDYYLTNDLIEPADAQEHYTERLVRLKHNGFLTFRPKVDSSALSKADFGLPTDRRLYFCPMMLQKIHPDFDRLVASILSADPDGEVVFPEDDLQQGTWAKLLQKRFDRDFSPEMRTRIRFVPWQKRREDFVALLRCVDALLDPTHFGGGTTGVIAMEAGIPLVTWPGEFCRGRVIAGLYRYIGVEDTIADSGEAYVAKALRLANDHAWRDEIGERMRTKGQIVFDNPAAIEELATALLALASKTPVANAEG